MRMKYRYKGHNLNLRGRYIRGIYHHRTLYTWEFADQLRPARNW